MLSFATCVNVPVRGGRGVLSGGGGLVEVEGRVVWGGGRYSGGYGGGVYVLDEVRSKWSRVADSGEVRGTLAVCGGRLVWVGGVKVVGVMSKKVKELRGRRWSHMSDMLVGCWGSCVLSVSGGGMVVMGGNGDAWRLVMENGRLLNDVQVFDGGTQTWHRGPSLPKPCAAMSAVVHGDLVFVMGGVGMDRAVWCADIRDLQSIWRQLPDVPYYWSSVCVGDGVLLAIGGAEDLSGSKKTSSIYGLHGVDKKWKHVGDMPFACDSVDTLMLSDGGLLVVDDKSTSLVNRSAQQLCFRLVLYEEAMSKGYVETSVTKCLILGAAGVGKTHLKHLLLKKDPPGQRVSTGVADNPARAISFSLAGVSVQEEDDWFVVEDDQALLRVVGGTIRDGGVSMTTSLDEVVSSFPKMTIHVSSDGAGAVHPDPTPARVNTTMDFDQQSRTVSIEEELIHHINHSSETCCGHICEYYGADGKPVSRPYRSSLSHKQILQHCLGAMCSQDARPLIITVGTHRDAADRCSESIAEKSQKLKPLLDAGSFHIVYNKERLKEVVFAVNGKTPQDEDRRVAKVLREEILSVCPQPIKMPIAWFGLEVLLQRSSDDGILSLVECQGCAKRLHIEGDAFSAALHYLVHNNVFLHYPEVLPQTVFCDPQIVLTKVSEIVEYHHKLLYRPDEGVAAKGDLVKFRDHGLLSVELLNKFSKHYTEGLFIAQDLLKLLVSVGAIAMVGDEGIEYLMPALLPHLDSGQVTKYCQPGTSLIIVPSQGLDLCEGQLMWFGESGVTKQDSSATGTLPVTLDSEPSLQHLMEKVAAVIPSKYEMVGLQLGLTPSQLQAIRPQHQSLEDYHRAFGELFSEWRRRGSPPYTWRTLTGVLRSASVGEVLLSEQLTSWITQQ
eukprot:Em0002g414a